MRVGVLGNIQKAGTKETMEEIVRFLESAGYQTAKFTEHNQIDGVDVVLVLGGDGAILHSAVIAAKKNIRLIGINYGTLGFLTEYEKDERESVKDLLDLLQKNACKIIRRSILEVSFEGKVYYALNEVSLQRDYGGISEHTAQILRLEVEASEGKDLLSGDGVLFCTPTGSTAYSLSAGGAILTPEVPVVMMTPICAFSMRARPIVFSDTDEFTLRVVKGRARLLTDGGAIAVLTEGRELKIKKAPFTADFPVKEASSFLARVRNKLG